MLELQNISKYYSQTGAVSLGLRKINLTLAVGEVVCVVGESGSGKSTLLNVIGGLDSYEEGELFINGEQTSHYTIADWESYRKNYIGFVFQNYHLIESYTVLQNVETALILSGYDPKNRRKKALEIIEKVGLTKFKDVKTAKLSGGEIQRTVIARALAKDCQIIVCDEPTGNLDSKTSKQIIDLLHEVSKGKLVIIVTHNYKEVEHIATRKITLHDGHLVEDLVLKETKKEELIKIQDNHRKVKYIDILVMAFRNLTSTPFKTILFFMVLLMLTVGTSIIYGSTLNFKEDSSESNQNIYFENSMKERIILRKTDYSSFSQSELKDLRKLPYVKDVVTGDIALDVMLTTTFPIDRSGYQINSMIKPSVLVTKDALSKGRLPKETNEIVINTNAFREGVDVNDVLNKQFVFKFNNNNLYLTVVGITEDKKLGEIVYLNNEILNQITDKSMFGFHTFTIDTEKYGPIWIQPYAYYGGLPINDNEIIINTSLAEWFGYVPEEESSDKIVIGNTINLKISNLYETSEKSFIIAHIVPNQHKGEESRIYLTPTALDHLTKNDDVYQVSLIVEKYTEAKRVLDDINVNQYEYFYPYGTLQPVSYIISLFKTMLHAIYLILFIGMLFFMTYFILRNIMASKKTDYIILRSIGSTKKVINTLTLFELLVISTFSYIFILLIIYTNLYHFVSVYYLTSTISKIYKYYRIIDYVFIYGIVLILVFLLSHRFNKRFFKNSIMLTFKGEEV